MKLIPANTFKRLWRENAMVTCKTCKHNVPIREAWRELLTGPFYCEGCVTRNAAQASVLK